MEGSTTILKGETSPNIWLHYQFCCKPSPISVPGFGMQLWEGMFQGIQVSFSTPLLLCCAFDFPANGYQKCAMHRRWRKRCGLSSLFSCRLPGIPIQLCACAPTIQGRVAFLKSSQLKSLCPVYKPDPRPAQHPENKQKTNEKQNSCPEKHAKGVKLVCAS